MNKLTKLAFSTITLIAVVAFIAYGLWLANEPVSVPLQGQFEANTLNITSKITARIAAQHVREGDAVSLGTLLVTLDSPELRAKQAQVAAVSSAAQAKLSLVNAGARDEDIRAAEAAWRRAAVATELADKTFKRLHALYLEKLISQQRNDEAEANLAAAQAAERAVRAQYDSALHGARNQDKQAAGAMANQAAGQVAEVEAAAADTKLLAPLAAEVDKLVLHVGELAPAGFPIMTLVDLKDTWATFNIREDDLAGIHVGSEFDGNVPALGGQRVKLKVYYISPKGDFATWRPTRLSGGYDVKTFEVRARPVAPVEGLRPGMSVLVARG
jgi:HlyD family secretion protein